MTRELICGRCFDELGFRREESLPGAQEARDGHHGTCVVCSRPFPILPDDARTPFVDLVHSELLIVKLAARARHLATILEFSHARTG